VASPTGPVGFGDASGSARSIPHANLPVSAPIRAGYRSQLRRMGRGGCWQRSPSTTSARSRSARAQPSGVRSVASTIALTSLSRSDASASGRTDPARCARASSAAATAPIAWHEDDRPHPVSSRVSVAAAASPWTADPAATRAQIAEQLAGVGQLQSYRAILDREGAAGPEDILIAGDEVAVERGLRQLLDAGATELMAFPIGSPEEWRRTVELLGSLAQSAAVEAARG
jgi:hypothetical protein